MHCVCYCSSVIDYYPPLFVCLLVGGPGGLRLTFKYIDFLQICFCLHWFDFLSVFVHSRSKSACWFDLPTGDLYKTSICIYLEFLWLFNKIFSGTCVCEEWSQKQKEYWLNSRWIWANMRIWTKQIDDGFIVGGRRGKGGRGDKSFNQDYPKGIVREDFQ